ncbi:hypothetical protein CN326_13980 [Bacillus sp. AFS018417]|uniref:hypothetical protein n=1 Tax=Bacillus sp. AFS018417 TaxID=2033491 RepID=UPI000BF5122E|nr:hypothetical protein [Bacillus sp. AFS018417]PEZ05567.1 hypothetical protein CN326_13980 [Bacillus sp. AFS018417]
MVVQHINYKDKMFQGTDKLNESIDQSNEAIEKAKTAEINSTSAVDTANSVQTQLNTIVINNGQSDAEVLQGRVDANGNEFGTIKLRIDAEQNKIEILQQNIGSIEQFGGKVDWDGISGTENSVAFSNAFNSGDTVYIYLQKGKLKTSPLILPTDKNIVIQGMGKDLTEIYCTGRFFTCSNTAKFTTTVSVALTEGDRFVTLSSITGAEVGQLITLSSTQNMEEIDRTVIKSHSAIITAINGNVVTLDRHVPCDFSITGFTVTAKGYKVGKVKLSNMTISGEYDGYFGDISFASGFEVENLKVVNRNKKYQGETTTEGFDPSQTGGTMHGFRVQNAIDAKFINPEFEYLSYGVMPTTGAVGTTVERSVARRCRHTAAPTGGSQGFTCRDGRAYECYAGYDSHEGAYDSRHFNCHSFGDEVEVKLRGRHDIVDGCSFSGGVLTRHDTGLRSLSVRDKFKKSIVRTRTDKHAIFDQSCTVKISDCLFKEYVSNYQIIDSFSIEDTTIHMLDGTIVNNWALWLATARVNTYRNLRVFGPYRGKDKTGATVSANIHKAFRIDRNEQSGTVKLENIEIDGFDHGLSFTVAMDLSKFIFENIQMKNCVYGIWNEANYKDNPTFRNLSYSGCATNVQQPYRFRYNTRPSNPIHGQSYWDETIKKAIWYDALASAWKDASGVSV